MEFAFKIAGKITSQRVTIGSYFPIQPCPVLDQLT
jgi:hypothetical protein